ncbi:MAG: DUF262 domain-containing protein [Candidatus Nanopelagicaceae bacterium]
MATTMFKDTTHTVFGLIEDIKSGEVALPDIQRPFVWTASKVRELIDSMYKGFPVGYLLFWDTGAEVGARQIGVESKERAPRLLIVDGQQRLTSLYVVITGAEIIREDYSQGRIRIAFRPSDSTFAVTDAAIERDPEFIPDISKIWVSGERKNEVRAFKKRLREKREFSQSESDELEEAIDRLHDIRDYPFKAVELNSSVDEELVAEVFVRINSAGVTLNQADFILTLMSVFWEKGRRDLEEFARNCKQPTLSQASPFNWYIQPTPAQMLRVTVGLAFRRAVLKHVYSLLRGKDVDTGKSIPERRDAQFAIMQKAHDKVLDITNWHEFLQCLERGGFRGSKMISSDNALLFSYALWLIGRVEYGVPLDKLREAIARWFFMAHTTARYSGAFESAFEQDVARLSDVAAGDANGFISILSKVVDDAFTSDYWEITLPNELATSASKSPALLSYIAALNILDADSLLSTGKVRSRLDPAITAKKGIERHHIFPRAYLSSVLKVQDKREINQIANMALVEWADNIAISDDAPTKYWPEQLESKKLDPQRLQKQMYWHALPEGWESMPYQEFLEARRRLMGGVVRDAFALLREQSYAPEYPTVNPTALMEAKKARPTGLGVSISDLLDADIVQVGATLSPANDRDGTVVATILPDGKVALNDEVFSSLSGAAYAATGIETNGWFYWAAETLDGRFTMAALRELYADRKL